MECPVSSNDSSAVWTVDGIFMVAYSEVGNRELVIDNIRWKFVAVVAIIAMAVSLLSGGLSGIRIGVLIMRALMGGVAFTVLGIGLNLLVARFFPEILDTGSAVGAEISSEADAPGSRVNIVMPSEAPGVSGSLDEGSGNAVSDTGDADKIDENDEDIETVEPVDSMDDLDRFSGSFSESDDDKPDSRRSTTNGSGDNHDPEELAQAIHTVIKRDEKG